VRLGAPLLPQAQLFAESLGGLIGAFVGLQVSKPTRNDLSGPAAEPSRQPLAREAFSFVSLGRPLGCYRRHRLDAHLAQPRLDVRVVDIR
jgi:hypothetical protein